MGGLKRHITCKHTGEKENDPGTDDGEEDKFTNEMLAKIVDEVKRRLVDNKVFSKDIREELRSYELTYLPEESMELAELQKIFKQLMKKKDQEKFYATFYSTVPLNSTKYFTGLSRNAATLLSTKVADIMIVYSKEKSFIPGKDFEIKLSDKEMAGLQYVGGYVLHKLYKKHTNSKVCESTASQQSIAILKAGKEEHLLTENHKLTSSLNRGGLWGITKPAQTIFIRTEKYFRFLTSNYPVTRIDINEIMSRSINDSEVLTAFICMKATSELKLDDKVAKDVLQSIIHLYIRVRSFSFARDVVQKYKLQMKLVKEKALRKNLSRASKDSELRQP